MLWYRRIVQVVNRMFLFVAVVFAAYVMAGATCCDFRDVPSSLVLKSVNQSRTYKARNGMIPKCFNTKLYTV